MKPAADPRWQFGWLLAAPHRLAFFAAALMLAGTALWWAGVLLARAGGVALPWALPPPAAHALLMSLGFMPLFFVGFLFTAGPKWLGQPDVGARSLLVPVSAMLAGWALVLPGVHLGTGLAGAGMALVAVGWSRLSGRFIGLLQASRRDDAAQQVERDRVHAGIVAAAGVFGAATMWLAAAALTIGDVSLLRAATQAALWGFVATVFATVSHRMLPFFSASALPSLDAWRPFWLLAAMVFVLAFEAVLAPLQLLWPGPLPPALRWLQVAIEAPAAVLLLWLALRWGLLQSRTVRLLAMLHGGFLWLGIALALAAVSHLMMALSADEQSLGLAPTHALTMGYLGATLFAMATRVSSGHSGRPLAADNSAWGLYWVLQVAVVSRVAAALWPAGAAPLTLLAVAAWVLAMVGWALRHGNRFGRPRADGRPG